MTEFLTLLTTTWWGITLICLLSLIALILISALLYKPFFKRFYDILLSGIAILVLSPVFLILIVLGAIKMKGNPFFTQQRPGKKGKIFRLIKFRTMTNQKDIAGNLLPDEVRLTRYGKILRTTSLDELPELLNIFIGNMSIVGPRPLLVKYLPYYTIEENRRHDVLPGLTGLAQVSGRNNLIWEERFGIDVKYVDNLSLWLDIKIIINTIKSVFLKEDIVLNAQVDFDEYRQAQYEDKVNG